MDDVAHEAAWLQRAHGALEALDEGKKKATLALLLAVETTLCSALFCCNAHLRSR